SHRCWHAPREGRHAALRRADGLRARGAVMAAETARASTDRYNRSVETLSRRQLLQGAAAAAAVMATPLSAWPAPERGKVVVVRESNRAKAVAACLDALEFRACEGRGVAIKANFNSADAFPASTHPE